MLNEMEEIITWSVEEEVKYKQQQAKCLMLEQKHRATREQQAAELLEAHNHLKNLDELKKIDERAQRILTILDEAIPEGYDLPHLKMLVEKFKQRKRIREEQRVRGGEGETDSSGGTTTPEIEREREREGQRSSSKERGFVRNRVSSQSASSTSSRRPIEATPVDVSLVIF